METRDLTASDRDAAVALWQATGLTRPWNDPAADFDRALGAPTSTVLGSFDGDGLVATVMLGHDGRRGWLYYLAVLPSRQGEGLGARLLQCAEQRLRELGAVKVNVMVRASNAGVRAFYERLGYEDSDVMVLGRRLD